MFLPDVKGAPGDQTTSIEEPNSNSTALAFEVQRSAADQREKLYERSSGGSLRQGEILSDLIQSQLNITSLELDDGPKIDYKVHPYAVVVAQDCELIQDFTARQRQIASDKLIPNVLFCEAVTAQELRGRDDIKSDIWKRIRQNKDERYQFLESVTAEQDVLGLGLPELGLDFKRYFSVPTEEVYYWLKTGATRRSRLVTPYVEHLSTRFFNYQSRVALPAEHRSI